MQLLHQLALFDPAAAPSSAAGQGIGFRDIPWGSGPQTVTDRLLAAGMHPWEDEEGEEPSPYGDLSFLYGEQASLTATFADGALVSFTSILEVADGTRDAAYREFREALIARYGPPDYEEELGADWRDGETALALSSRQDENSEYLSLMHMGPGYRAEYRRRLLAEGTLYAPLEPGWTVVSESVESRVAFDPATLAALGRGLVRASVRTDHVDLVHDPDLHDQSVREVEADCAKRCLRVLSAVYLDGGEVCQQPPGQTGDWISTAPGSAEDLLVAALCAASGRL